MKKRMEKKEEKNKMSLEQLSTDPTIEFDATFFQFELVKGFQHEEFHTEDALQIKVEKGDEHRTAQIRPVSVQHDRYLPHENLRRISAVQLLSGIESENGATVYVYIATDNGSHASALTAFEVDGYYEDSPLHINVAQLYGVQFPFQISGLIASTDPRTARSHAVVYGLNDTLGDRFGGVYLVSYPDLEIRELVSIQDVLTSGRPLQLKTKPLLVDGRICLCGSDRTNDVDIAELVNSKFQVPGKPLGNYPLEPIKESRFLYGEDLR